MLTFLTSALLIAAAAGSPVADWVEHPMSAADLTCANYSAREWAVRLGRDGVVRAFPAEHRELFERRVPGGYLVGIDRGEWGGGAWWLGDDGQSSHLTTANVSSIVVNGEDVWLLTDVERSAVERGVVHLAKRRETGWSLQRVAVLETSGLQATADGSGALLVLASDGLHRVARSGESTRLAEGDFGALYSTSMVRDARGHVFVGMRHVVVEFVPAEPRWKARWLVPADCVRFAQGEDDDCACQGPARP